jgi:hypothetical protein
MDANGCNGRQADGQETAVRACMRASTEQRKVSKCAYYETDNN